MRRLKHLPLKDWPAADTAAFAGAYEHGDVFDETNGPGAHHSEGWRRMVRTSYRRWLGFLSQYYPADLLRDPATRITPELVRAFVEQLSTEVRPTTVAIEIANLYAAARLIAPEADWRWLASVRSRLTARAEPENRLHRLVPGWETLDLGLKLLVDAGKMPRDSGKERDIQFRDGLMLVLLSLWNIRRRSFAALTVTRHIELEQAGVTLLLYPEDTKGKREESCRVPDAIVPYFLHYLKVVRPRLVGRKVHDGLWASCKDCPLTAGRIYDIVRARIKAAFGKDMGLHDFRRAAATFLAIEAPDQVGLIPGILQHTSLEVGEKHYNLAQSVEASRRVGAHLAKLRARLKPIKKKD
jgi:integrase/recombinase XerD